MKHTNIIIIVGCVLLATSVISGTYAYHTYNEEAINSLVYYNTSFRRATMSNATISNAEMYIATDSNADTDLDDDEKEWLSGDNVELINDLD